MPWANRKIGRLKVSQVLASNPRTPESLGRHIVSAFFIAEALQETLRRQATKSCVKSQLIGTARAWADS